MVLVTPFLIRKSSSAAIFGFSLYSISSTYFLVELVVGIVFIFLKQDSYKLALIVQVIIAGIYAVMLISHLIANESTADNVERHEQEVAYIKDAASRVKLLVGKIPDKKSNREIEKLYDLLHSSPSKSNSTVHNLEVTIVNLIEELESAISYENKDEAVKLAVEITKTVEERNRRLRQQN